MNTLTNRLYDAALEKHDGDKRKACKYLRQQAMKYAHMADARRGTTYHAAWKRVYQSYSSAAFQMDYYLNLDTEYEVELANIKDYPQ